jgi:hypothetical protein
MHCFFVQVTRVHQIIQVLSKNSEDLVHSDRRPQEVASLIAEANTVILVCVTHRYALHSAWNIYFN